MQQPRQQYGLGSFVKKAFKGVTKGIKKIAKSDLGKAALLAGGAYFAPTLFGKSAGFGNFGNLLKSGVGSLASKFTGKESIANFLKGEKTFGKTLGVMAGGTLLGGLLSKAEQGDEEAIEATQNVGALKNYLTQGYTNLGYKENEIPKLVENDLSEYTQDMARGQMADGGRIKFGSGSEDYGDLIDAYEKGIDVMEGESLSDYINRIRKSERKNSAMGGRIGYADGTDFENYLKGKKKFQQQQNLENEYKEYLEDKRRQKVAEQKTRAANGGRIGYAFGNKPEQNAIQAAGIEGLPLNQNPAGVTELDLRDSGGFIPPVGVKEKADDIPAMLANNEFVFTADAVRGMGDGNVNKGAQRMYDMMKKLEKGGRV